MPTTTTTFSMAEAAVELGITERRVRQLVDEGRLKVVEDGMGRQRLTRAAVNAEIARRGRTAVRSLPSTKAEAADPLLERLDEQSELLRELVNVVRGLQVRDEASAQLLEAVHELASTTSDMRKVLQRAKV